MFTKNAIDALNAAASCARQLGHDHIGAEHIFLSILAIPKCQACRRLESLGLAIPDLAESMRTMIAGNAAPEKVRYWRFTGLNEQNGREFASLAEICIDEAK